MTKKQTVTDYIMGLDKDFTISDVSDALDISRCTIYDTVENLMGAKKLFHVGFEHGNIQNNKLFSLEDKEFNKIPIGTPKSDRDCTSQVMLWVDGDFTVNEITEWLGISIVTAHNAKERLLNDGLIFKVGDIRGQNSMTYFYNTIDREYEVKQDKQLIKQRKRKVKNRKPKKQVRQVYHPVDPLAGFVRPVDKTLSITNSTYRA